MLQHQPSLFGPLILKRAEYFKQLSTEPLFQSGLKKIRKGRQKNSGVSIIGATRSERQA
jgi:hypothetical protein